MDANDLNFMEFLGQRKTRFVIPVYQRNYDWKVEHCKQLLDDILQCGRDNDVKAHFIGSIVYIHDDIYSASKVKELTIIDGQQRLTTITLIWLVIYKLARSLRREELVEDIYESYLVNKREAEKLKLRPTENNDRALHYIINGGNDDEYRGYSRLIENFEYFRSRISKENLDVVLSGLNKLMFVEVSLERGKDDPQRIFESLNSTGLDLSQADLIRNYLLMGLRREDQHRVYENYWRPIELLAREENNNNGRVSDFIRDFLTIKNKKIPNKQKVYQEFKKTFDFKSISKLEQILKELKKYVKYYNRLLNVQNEPDRDIRQQLEHINRLEINVSYPFLLQVYDDFSQEILGKQGFIQVMSLVESFVWRRFIAGVPTNALNKIFMRLYEDVDTSDYLNSLAKSLVKKKSSQRFPKDAEILVTLKERDVYSVQSRNRTYLLERIENFQNNELVRIEDNPNITIEHIFPQNPEQNWRSDLSEGEYQQLSEVYLHTLANLTLSGNNGSLGNKVFKYKRDLSEKGYRDSRLYLNRYLSKLERWGIPELEKRFSILSQRFLEIWPYPDIQLEEEIDYEEVNIFEAEDPTKKKLEYAIFLDEKLRSKRVSDLFVYVFSKLFELDPERFFTTDLAERVEITKESDSLRYSKQISDTYYIEAHLNNKDKFERLKYALAIFEFTDDLFIKYAS